jgi:hypothetical protein
VACAVAGGQPSVAQGFVELLEQKEIEGLRCSGRVEYVAARRIEDWSYAEHGLVVLRVKSNIRRF